MYNQIIHPIHGRINYVPRRYQQDLINKLDSGCNVILKSARQMGASTTIIQYILSKMLQSDYKAVVIGCNSIDVWRRSLDDKFIVRSNQTIFAKHNSNSNVQFTTIRKLKNDYRCLFGVDVFLDGEDKIDEVNQLISDIIRTYDWSINLRFALNPSIDLDGYDIVKWPFTLNDDFSDSKWECRMRQLLGNDLFDREFVK